MKKILSIVAILTACNFSKKTTEDPRQEVVDNEVTPQVASTEEDDVFDYSKMEHYEL